MAKTTNQPTIEHIRATLREYEQSRQPRTKEVCETAGFATRLEAFASFWHRVMSLYVVPYAGDMLVDVHCQAVAQAPKLDFLPLPDKSLRDGTIFQIAQLRGQEDKPIWRVLRALPFILLCIAAHNTMGSTLMPHINQLSSTERLCLVEFLGDLTPLYIIAMVESVRRGNNFTIAVLWSLFGLVGQSKGMVYAVPLYFFLHYVQCSMGRCSSPDNRHVPIHYASTLVAAVGAGYLLPTAVVLFGSTNIDVSYLWKLFPILTTILHRVFASFVPNTSAVDRIENPRADMRYLRLAYGIGGILAGITRVYFWITPVHHMANLLSDMLQMWHEPLSLRNVDLRQLIRHNHLLVLGSGLFWELLHFRDLKNARRLKASWIKVLGGLATTAVIFGPGSAMALGWAWREEVLASKIQLN